MSKIEDEPYFRFSDLTESGHAASDVIKIFDPTGKSLVKVLNELEDFFHISTCLSE